MRALLLALDLPAATSSAEFWHKFGTSGPHLAHRHVEDPFAGGGSTLIEAARMGASVHGADVDGLAVRIVQYALSPAAGDAVDEAGLSLLDYLSKRWGPLYPQPASTQPLHYFSVASVTCPECGELGELYRDLVLARDLRKRGAVVRNESVVAFCPVCFDIHGLLSADRVRLHCCGRYHALYEGTYHGVTYACRACGTKSTHRQLATGQNDRRVVAIESTDPDGYRTFRRPCAADVAALRRASNQLRTSIEGALPIGVPTSASDGRPASFGVETFADLFTPRQLLVFRDAFEWVRTNVDDAAVRSGLEIALSNSLTSNNRLCGYARDYGRLSSLFSVRGYSLPALAVELNPLHRSGGRGTIQACVSRVVRSADRVVRRHRFDPGRGVAATTYEFSATQSASVHHRSATRAIQAANGHANDIAVFDPPYFDFIPYDELSEFHRAWFPGMSLAGAPLLPNADDPIQSFGIALGRALQGVADRLKARRPIAFTYHGSKREAWQAIGVAIDEAQMTITAMWPVRSDGRMGHHSHDGNCEWDVVVVCRRSSEVARCSCPSTVKEWSRLVSPLKVSAVDKRNFAFALEVAQTRFGRVPGGCP
jgi:adenine-specific DNA methylase